VNGFVVTWPHACMPVHAHAQHQSKAKKSIGSKGIDGCEVHIRVSCHALTHTFTDCELGGGGQTEALELALIATCGWLI
jgi:hypothetical protein